MAVERNIAEADRWFLGEDKTLRFAVTEEDGTTPLNVTGMSFRWVLSEDPSSPATLISKATGQGIVVSGTYNVDPELNAQKVLVFVQDSDTDTLDPGNYHHALKRMDDGFETIVTFGRARLLLAAIR